MSTEITCEDCHATSLPCHCCEWCEMFPCECTDEDFIDLPLNLTPAEQAELRERFHARKATR